MDGSYVVSAALRRAGQPREAEPERLPAHRGQQCVAVDVPLPLLAGPVPGRAIHLDRELDLLAGGVKEERPSGRLDPVLEREVRHSGGPQHVQAAPDLQFALASLGE
jgi:hypothetical protein